ncbi:TrmB family transcriptional regulator [Halomarina litorea]|uniref:TrmB family transcriptional regulator n=1 Tax=Halomarina litorea TaxID=2961595 RepID=UPI0020C49A89|nr:helix-turn-helix domain-containing protein [Halomarina sp. BCD28]
MKTNEDAGDDPAAIAETQLKALGLSTYAARTFVALAELGMGTAEDVSRIVDVPRTRVYDAADELHEWGLVDVQRSTPRRFWPVSATTAERTLERAMHQRLSSLTEALDRLESTNHRDEQHGVWTITGQEEVTERVLEFVAHAEEEVVFMTVETLLDDELVDELRRAVDRGVSVHLGGISPEVQRHLREEIPSADLFESLWLWSDTPAGRLLMVDGETTLASVLVEGGRNGVRRETAIWGSGESNSLVVVLRAIFTWRLGDGGE